MSDGHNRKRQLEEHHRGPCLQGHDLDVINSNSQLFFTLHFHKFYPLSPTTKTILFLVEPRGRRPLIDPHTTTNHNHPQVTPRERDGRSRGSAEAQMPRCRLRQRCGHTPMSYLSEAREGDVLLRARLLQAELGGLIHKLLSLISTNIRQSEHKKDHVKAQSNPLRNLFPPKIVSEPDPATGHFNPFPTFPYTGPLRPVYPLSPKREVPAKIKLPDYAHDGIPRSEQTIMRRHNISILNAKEIAGMRKVCRLAREVLDLAAAAAVPGVTTDHIDEVVHKACLERDVRLSYRTKLSGELTITVLSLPPELRPLPQISVHFSQRSHLPWYPRSVCSERRGYREYRCHAIPRRLPRRSERDLLHWRQGKGGPRLSASG